MSNINGSGPQNIVQGDSIGVGLTSTEDGSPVVLLWVEFEGEHYGVALDEESTMALAQSLIKMASEVTQLQDSLHLTPAEMDERMRRIIEEGGKPQD